MARVIVFDLDDTLFAERDYVRSGFLAVDQYLVSIFGIGGFFDRAWSLFEIGNRGTTFETVLPSLGLTQPELVRELVEVYRNHMPDIALLPDAEIRLNIARAAGDALALISDGPHISQQKKVAALKLDRWFSQVILTDLWGREYWKPNARAFKEIMLYYKNPACEFTYVADNPTKDFVAPRHLGWKTVQVKRPLGEYRNAAPPSADYAPDSTIVSLLEV